MWVLTSNRMLVNVGQLHGIGVATHKEDRKVDEGQAVLRSNLGILEQGPEGWVLAAFALIAAGLANGRTFVDVVGEVGAKPEASRIVVA